MSGFPGTPTLEAIEGLRLNTAVESSGTFTCSNDLINRIQTMVQWTLLSNLFSVQSDCPAREKFQYGGDIVASSDMAILNYDMSSFYAKTVQDHQDAARDPGWFTETAPFVGISAASYEAGAGPIGWGLAHPLLVVQLYQYYGNERLVQRVTVPLNDLRPGVGRQQDVRIAGFALEENDEITVEIEKNLTPEDLRTLPEFADVSGG